jgi:predicted metal-dependent peptidase
MLLDGSGSMDHWFPYAWGAIRQLAKTALPHVIIYSDRVLWAGRTAPPEHIEGLGGGTNIQPALDAAKQLEPDLIIVYTDGEHEDAIQHPAAPIIWVIVPDGQLRPTHIRPKDKVICMKRDDSEGIIL